MKVLIYIYTMHTLLKASAYHYSLFDIRPNQLIVINYATTLLLTVYIKVVTVSV